MRVGILVGNPKPKSRTLEAARLIARDIFGRDADFEVDIFDLGTELMSQASQKLAAAVRDLRSCGAIVVASPTYKASYTGLLKLFLDVLPPGALDGIFAFPVMVGAAPDHSLAAEVFLRPVLVELGASCPAKGIYLLDTDYADDEKRTRVSNAARKVMGRFAAQ
jgi:FMN reductase